MPNYIVLRLTPPAAIDAATFTTYLTNLTIKVYDISYAQATAGTLIGLASFAGAQIVQHTISQPVPPLQVPASVATAVIQYDPPVPPAGPLAPVYVGPALRIEFDRPGV